MRIDKAKPIRAQSRTLILACVCLIAVAGIHCGGGEDRAYSRGSTITVLYPGDERILGPYQEMPAKFLVFLPLVTHDENGETVGQLATAWEHSSDYRRWTFHLRSDIRWHDGMPFTAHDIKFSLELFAHPDVLFDVPQSMESVTVLDDSTFTITFTKPMDALDTWRVYYPKHLLEDLDPKEFWKWRFWTQPVGNGPYRYVRHVPQTMMEFEANSDHYRGKPRIERVVLKFSGSASLVELTSGNVDVLTHVNRMDIPKLAADPRFRVYSHIWPSVAWLEAIFWNQRNPLFQDRRVRRALTFAIDRGELRQILNLPEDLVTADVIFTAGQYWRGELPEPLLYRPQDSRRLLEEAGWHEAGVDGVREREGEEFSFTVIVPSEGAIAGASLMSAAIYVQSQFRHVGVHMEVQVLESNLVRQRLRSGEFEAAFFRFFNAVAGHIQWFGKDSWIGYDNPRVAELLNAVQETSDLGEIDRIYRELFPIFLAELPVTFLFPQVTTTVTHRRVHGLSNPFWADPVSIMEHLWLEE